MTPYYEHAGITIYHGDCREVLPQMSGQHVIITDPVWPNTLALWIDQVGDPYKLFAEAAGYFPALAERVVVHLGGASDPRFLLGIPETLKYVGTCWLRYALPSFRGRMMVGADIAYVFGTAPKGVGCVPSEGPTSQPGDVNTGHPCPRRIIHVNWLVKWFANGIVLDPFAGIGTTLVAAKNQGFTAIGIEIEEKYCEIAARRLAQEVLPL